LQAHGHEIVDGQTIYATPFGPLEEKSKITQVVVRTFEGLSLGGRNAQ